MRAPRFYYPSPLTIGDTVELPPEAAHHALRVLRLRPGDAAILFTGQGGEFSATIDRMEKDRVHVRVQAWEPLERESPLDVTLIQALSSNDKMDLVLQKATELGARRLVIVESTRGVVRLDGERAKKRMQRWQQLLIAACEQCGRNRIPALSFASLVDWLRDPWDGPHRWILAPGAQTSLSQLPPPRGAIQLLIGPEGGFNDQEYAAADTAGFVSVSIGPRTLRTETAGIAALAVLQALWGDG